MQLGTFIMSSCKGCGNCTPVRTASLQPGLNEICPIAMSFCLVKLQKDHLHVLGQPRGNAVISDAGLRRLDVSTDAGGPAT